MKEIVVTLLHFADLIDILASLKFDLQLLFMLLHVFELVVKLYYFYCGHVEEELTYSQWLKRHLDLENIKPMGCSLVSNSALFKMLERYPEFNTFHIYLKIIMSISYRLIRTIFLKVYGIVCFRNKNETEYSESLTWKFHKGRVMGVII